MDRRSLAGAWRIGVAGVLWAGALIGTACGRDAVTGANAIVGPSLVTAHSATGAGGAVVGATASFGLTPAQLIERGWSCRVTPEGTTACSPPGRGLPVFGAPADRPPSYLVHVFDTTTSEYLGFTRMIRSDLYEGQSCTSTGAAYEYLPHIGYYACFNPAGD
jgi:hypothetical protein